MDYRDPWLFDTVLKQIRERDIELLIGSSMGGYFAYCLSTMTGIPTVLFNPAVIGRSFPIKSSAYFAEYGIGEFEYHREDIGHRIPKEVFTRWVI
jgi:predicted esterase YcpF (UPF0227 family)